MSATLNYIDCILPDAVAATYNTGDLSCFFVGTSVPGTILRLTFPPDAYTPFPGIQPEVQKGYTTHFATQVDKERGFELQLKDGSEVIAYLLSDWQSSLYSSGSYSLMTIFDYHVLDDSTARANGYTTRYGWFSFERKSGTVRDAETATSRRFGLGLNLRFIQVA